MCHFETLLKSLQISYEPRHLFEFRNQESHFVTCNLYHVSLLTDLQILLLDIFFVPCHLSYNFACTLLSIFKVLLSDICILLPIL